MWFICLHTVTLPSIQALCNVLTTTHHAIAAHYCFIAAYALVFEKLRFS